MIPILAALFLLVGASYAVLKNKWLSLLCFGPITFISVVFMGQIDVFPALFIFISLILMQRALKAEKYFSLLLFAYLTLGISMQFKTYGGLLLPAYLIYTLALAKDKKLDLTKSFFTSLMCFATFLFAALIVWVPYPGWFSPILLHGESNFLWTQPSLLFQVPIWVIGYAFILCYMAVRVLGNPKRALQDNRYFVVKLRYRRLVLHSSYDASSVVDVPHTGSALGARQFPEQKWRSVLYPHRRSLFPLPYVL